MVDWFSCYENVLLLRLTQPFFSFWLIFFLLPKPVMVICKLNHQFSMIIWFIWPNASQKARRLLGLSLSDYSPSFSSLLQFLRICCCAMSLVCQSFQATTMKTCNKVRYFLKYSKMTREKDNNGSMKSGGGEGGPFSPPFSSSPSSSLLKEHNLRGPIFF